MSASIENQNLESSQEIISSQETQNLITKLETEKPDIADFAKKFQQHLKTKNFPDPNSELIASISILSEIKDKSQFQLAQQILIKTSLKPSLLVSKTKKKKTFLTEYL